MKNEQNIYNEFGVSGPHPHKYAQLREICQIFIKGNFYKSFLKTFERGQM